MATFNFSALADGQSIAFNPGADILNFDQTVISAADIRAVAEGTGVRITVVSGQFAGKDILLQNTTPLQLATSNTTFANGSALLFGDNAVGTTGDDLANTLTGTSGNDLLQGFGGADTMNGGLGNDTYIVSTGDVLSDTGGVDTVISDVSWTLASGFENLTLTNNTTRTDAAGNNANNVITGSDAANFINGRAGDDTIFGMGGNDSIDMSTGGTGLVGNRFIDGGAGIDTVDYDGYATSAVVANLATGVVTGGGTNGTGSATMLSIERLITGSFNDSITGSSADNYLDGRLGNDTVDGGAGNDSVMGGGGDDVLAGGAGVDTLVGGAGADAFVFAAAPGTANADIISDFASASDKIRLDGSVLANTGPSGTFAPADARFFAAAGATSGHDADDRVIYNTTTGQLFYDADGSGEGASQLIATLTGAPVLAAGDFAVDNGSAAGQTINGTAGNDSLNGTVGNDTIDGGAGNDTINGSSGNDSLIGGAGDDSLFGAEGVDTMQGGDGNDTLDGDNAQTGATDVDADVLDGGLGDDLYIVDNAADTLTDAGGVDTVRAVNVPWTLGGGFENLRIGNDEVETFAHGTGNELNNRMEGTGSVILDGLSGDDTLIGSAFSNRLAGGDGNDRLDASFSSRDNVLDGGTGNDTLVGGSTGFADYIFSVAPGTANADTIIDFDTSFDHVRLDGRVHQNIGASGNFVANDPRFFAAPGATSGHDADDRVVYNTTTGQLFYDADGSGAGVAQLIATLQGAPAISATNIAVDNGAAPSVITGTAGNDTLTGTAGNDTLDGGTGSDSLDGAAGSDSLIGGEGNDTLTGGAGNDTLNGGTAFTADVFNFNVAPTPTNADLIEDFSPGNDQIHLDGNAFANIGGSGQFVPNDERFFQGTSAHDATDRVIFDASNGSLLYDPDGTGPEQQQLIATVRNVAVNATDIYVDNGSGGQTITGTTGNDSIVGTTGNDTIDGGAGDDTINGSSGNDSLLGGAGNDSIFGAEGADTMIGGDGNDTLNGDNAPFGANTDADVETYDGGAGNDLFIVDNPADVVTDAGGVDTVRAVNINWTLGAGFENLQMFNAEAETSRTGTGNELNNLMDASGGWGVLMDGRAGNDTLLGSSFGIDTLLGGDGNDSIDGGEHADSIDGGAGDDTLLGGVGIWEDTLTGGDGNDVISGGEDHDTMTGGLGADAFVFAAAPGANSDLITDFTSGSDQIRLDGNVHANIGASGNFVAGDERFFAFAFANGVATAHDATDRVLYDTNSGNLWYDADGNGAAAPQLIATLTGAPAISATDIAVDNGSGSAQGGTGNDSINGTAGNDTIAGGDGNDTINGLAGDDSLIGGAGADSLVGGDGNDTLDGNHVVFIEQTDPDIDTMDGGLGSDSYFVDNPGDVLIDAGGVDTVFARQLSWTLGSGFENLTLKGTLEGSQSGTGNAGDNVLDASGVFQVQLFGLGGNDLLIGSNSHDTLMGGDGNDTIRGSGILDGGAGNDTLTGGDNTTYVFAAAPGAANADLITSFVSATGSSILLDGNVHPNIGASGQFAVGDARFFAAAGASAGHDADDRVVYDTTSGKLWYDADGSGAGAAQLIATLQGAPALASDRIFVNNGTAGQGTAGNDSLTGTAGNDTIDGGAGNDTINGLGGDDSLLGSGGDDSLDGGTGNDTLRGGDGNDALIDENGSNVLDGGLGNDFYRIGAGPDTLVDAGGLDSVQSLVLHQLTLGAGFENGELITLDAGSAAITGNELDNNLRQGGTTDTLLDGFAGNDSLFGGDGNDTLNGGAGNDQLFGDFGNDILRGGAGNDTLQGQDDADSFVFAEAGSADADQINVFTLGADKIHLDGTFFTAVGASGNFVAGDARFFAGAGATSGHDADDRVIYNTTTGELFYDADGSGAGASQLVATLIEKPALAATDIAVDNGTAGSTTTGTAGNDSLTGTAGDDLLQGLAGNDTLTGLAGNDTLDAGTGGDSLIGGTGNDTYIVDGPGDTVVENPGEGTDTVFSSATRTLDANVENLTLTGTDLINGTGNALNNVITGNGAANSLSGLDGNDTLDGGAGADTMAGGLGDDTYIVSTGDVISDTGGIDTIVSDVSWTMGSEFENLTLTGTVRTDAAGNNLSNVITGSDAANFINGRAGDDTIRGMGGNDSIDMSTGGTGLVGNRSIDGGAGTDTVDYDGYAQSAVFANLATGAVTGGGTNGTGSATMTSIERLITGSFNDSLTGSSGNDYLDGRGGNDTLNGGAGNDTLIGGLGNDSFVFSTAPSASNVDEVDGFVSGTDKLAFDDAAFTAIGAAGGFAAGDARFFAGAGATAGHDADDRLIYNTTTGALYYDADGSGAGAAQQVATIAAHPALAATDITVI